jgi:hypothetical protein
MHRGTVVRDSISTLSSWRWGGGTARFMYLAGPQIIRYLGDAFEACSGCSYPETRRRPRRSAADNFWLKMDCRSLVSGDHGLEW